MLVVLAAIWRLLEGDAKAPPALLRHAALVLLAGASAYLTAGATWPALLLMAGIITNISVGMTKWEDWGWMPLRYSGLAALSCLLIPNAWPYVLACVGCGLLYPALMAWGNGLPRFWKFDGPEAYARLVAGGVIIGSPSYLIGG